MGFLFGSRSVAGWATHAGPDRINKLHEQPGAIRPEYVLTRSAQGGEVLELHIEVAVNHLFGLGMAPTTARTDWRRLASAARPKSPSSTARPGICCGISK